MNNTKIVIHIPSLSNLKHFPWGKAAELMYNKIFFIIEENEDMYHIKAENVVAFNKTNLIEDLKNKIIYYINNDEERNKIIDKCYNYIKNNFNMDKLLEKII